MSSTIPSYTYSPPAYDTLPTSHNGSPLASDENSSPTSEQVGQTSYSLHDKDFIDRTVWIDAKFALSQAKKDPSLGNRRSLWIRCRLQSELFNIGCFIQLHAMKILVFSVFLMLLLSVGLKDARIENKVDKLWIQEGGRLEEELSYVRDHLGVGAGSTSEMVIQITKDESANILNSDALLHHLEVLKQSIRVSVDLDDVTWSLEDLCYAQTIPSMSEDYLPEQIMNNLLPCSIITPLDCFYEGSHLLGPNHPVHAPLGRGEGSMMLSWKTLNPQRLVERMDQFQNYFDFKHFKSYMKTAGITSGYQEKSCLNPFSSGCPSTAPNKHSKQLPDIGSELSGGCYGFATRYNHWPEQLIVGGGVKNRTGDLLRAKGLQSVVQLMGEKDLYEYWSHTYKVHTMDWSREKARRVLESWQKAFNSAVNEFNVRGKMHKRFEVHAFSNYHLDEAIEEFSKFEWSHVSSGFIVVLFYICITMGNRIQRTGGHDDPLMYSTSKVGLGLASFALTIISCGASLGLSTWVGLNQFNVSSTHVLPFLALGICLDSMFLLAYTYADVSHVFGIKCESLVGEMLKRSGISILIASVTSTLAFASAALIPIPALRSFSLHCAVICAFNTLTTLVVFPACIALDIRRLNGKRYDVFCCYKKKQSDETDGCDVKSGHKVSWMSHLTVDKLVQSYLHEIYTQRKFRNLIFIFSIFLIGSSVYGAVRVESGLDLTDVIPRNSSVYAFLDAQSRYFGFYNVYAVTKGNFEYPQNQQLIHDYHSAFVRVPDLIKNDDGGLPHFWLSLFRKWLLKVQSAFDADFKANRITRNGTWSLNATELGVLGYKLMVQTGHVDYPVDMSLLDHHNRLVDGETGIINPSAFYNYLSAWYTNDAMAASFSQASFVPTPKQWVHDARDHGLMIPKSQPIIYAQMPFHLNSMNASHSRTVETVKQIRSICDKFDTLGLNNFPRGIPFSYHEQYITLRFWLGIALLATLSVIFVCVAAVTCNSTVAAICSISTFILVLQIYGVMGFFNLKFSAIPAIVLVISCGLSMQQVVHILLGFVSCNGSGERRVGITISKVLTPIIQGLISSLLATSLLAFSNFDFVVRYFFILLSSMIILNTFNVIFTLPILLCVMAPKPDFNAQAANQILHAKAICLEEVGQKETMKNKSKDTEQGNKLPPPVYSMRNVTEAPPTNRRQEQQRPPPHRYNLRSSRSSAIPYGDHRGQPLHHHSDASLSTIPEEESVCSVASSYEGLSFGGKRSPPLNQHVVSTQPPATSVQFEPHVVVETTSSNNKAQDGSLCESETTTTKVTAKFMVELHHVNNNNQTQSFISSPQTTNCASSSGQRRSRHHRKSSSMRSSEHRRPTNSTRVHTPPPCTSNVSQAHPTNFSNASSNLLNQTDFLTSSNGSSSSSSGVNTSWSSTNSSMDAQNS